MFDFIRIRDSHPALVVNHLIAAANAIFYNDKQPLRCILKTFLKTTPVNYRNRRMNKNRSIKHCVSNKILEKYIRRSSYFRKLGL